MAFVVLDELQPGPSVRAALERLEKARALFPETVALLIRPSTMALRELQQALPSIETARSLQTDGCAPPRAVRVRLQPCSSVQAAASACCVTAAHNSDEARRRKGIEWIDQQHHEHPANP